MTFHSEGYAGPCLFLLALAAIAPSVADRLRTNFPLPAGYGAEGDRRRVNPGPAFLRPAVEELSAAADGSWVKETVEDGAWVYELHLDKGGTSSVVRLNSDGRVIRPEGPEPDPKPVATAEAGG
jgi:hypothetical protein